MASQPPGWMQEGSEKTSSWSDDTQEVLSLERPSKRRRVPSQKVLDEFNAGWFLDAHLVDIQKFVLLGMRPGMISTTIKKEYGVDVDSKLISNKIKNWKVNGKIKVPPVNESSSRASDTPYPPTKCTWIFLIYVLKLIFFSGKEMARGINAKSELIGDDDDAGFIDDGVDLDVNEILLWRLN